MFIHVDNLSDLDQYKITKLITDSKKYAGHTVQILSWKPYRQEITYFQKSPSGSIPMIRFSYTRKSGYFTMEENLWLKAKKKFGLSGVPVIV